MGAVSVRRDGTGQSRAVLGELRHDRLKPVLRQARRLPHNAATAVPNRITWRPKARRAFADPLAYLAAPAGGVGLGRHADESVPRRGGEAGLPQHLVVSE
jgi:hypothetical protein